MNPITRDEFIQKAITADVDIFLSSISFEERCFVLPMLATEFRARNMVFFYNDNNIDLIKDNKYRFEQYYANLNAKFISLDSEIPKVTYDKFEKQIDEFCANSEKPLNVLLDITAFTHESLLICLRLLALRAKSLGKIYLGYVGASNYSTNSPTPEKKWLTKGVKQIRTVLGYPGFTDPTMKNHLMLLFGFETERTKEIIEKYAYDHITIAIGSDSIQSEHGELNRVRFEELLTDFPYAKKFEFTLKDCIRCRDQILEYLSQAEYKITNNVIAPLNNKMSTVGAGLAAMVDTNIQLAYAQANVYNVSGYSSPSSDFYFQELTLPLTQTSSH